MNIYVSNLGYSFRDEDLNKLFANYGTVSSAKVVMDTFSRQSKGFGFVEMRDRAAGEKAIKDLNGIMKDGRSIKVNEAKPKEDKNDNRNSFSRRW